MFKQHLLQCSRYPRAVLRQEMEHGFRNTLATTALTPRRSFGNNAGLGPPHQPRRVRPRLVPAQVGGQQSRSSTRQTSATRCEVSLKGFTRRELHDTLSKQCVKGAVKQPPINGSDSRATLNHHRSRGVGVPPARPTAPDRRAYRFGSAKRIRSLGTNPREVEMAEEYEDDKVAKSAVESVRSRLAWWRKRAKEHNPKSWLQVCT